MLADRVRMGVKADVGMVEIKVYATYNQSKPADSRIAFFPIIKEFETWDEVYNNPSIYLGNPVDVTDATYATPINVETLGIDKTVWGHTTGYVMGFDCYLNGTQIGSASSSLLGNSYLGFNDLRRWQSPTATPLIEGDIVGAHFGYD